MKKTPTKKTKSVKKSAPRRPVQGAGSPAPVELDGARGTSPGPLTGHSSEPAKSGQIRPLHEREVAAREALSWAGRMVGGSKSEYMRRYPSHVVFFNANLYGSDAAKLWFGDLDFNQDTDKLQHLADQLGETLFATREMPFRFEEPLTLDRLQAALDAGEARCFVPKGLVF